VTGKAFRFEDDLICIGVRLRPSCSPRLDVANAISWMQAK
jgi:hypothetical protein